MTTYVVIPTTVSAIPLSLAFAASSPWQPPTTGQLWPRGQGQ